MTSISSTHIRKLGIKKAILMVPFILMNGSAMVAEERGHVVSLSAAASFER
jgi:predicted ribosome-associated RNA-binding protein Tma20